MLNEVLCNHSLMVGLLDKYFQLSVVARVAQDFMFGSYLFSYIYK